MHRNFARAAWALDVARALAAGLHKRAFVVASDLDKTTGVAVAALLDRAGIVLPDLAKCRDIIGSALRDDRLVTFAGLVDNHAIAPTTTRFGGACAQHQGGGGVTGAPGHNAARVVARDLRAA